MVLNSTRKNLSRLKRTDFHIRAGKPFRLENRGEKVTRQVRENMMDEMMFQVASVLPPESIVETPRRGVSTAEHLYSHVPASGC
jgi:hypothetical protein